MKKLFVLAFSLLFFVAKLQAATMHAILIADTNDKGISGYSRNALDLDYVHNELQELVVGTPLNLKEYFLIDNDFTYANLEKTVSELNVEKKDVILVYFTGPSSRQNSAKTLFPDLQSTAESNSVIGFSDIKNKLLSKKPRLLVVLLETHNIDPSNSQKSKPGAQINISEKYNRTVNHLLSADGWIIAAAAKPNTYAASGEDGGIFTRVFFDALKTSDSWKDVMKQVSDELKKEPFPSYPVAEGKLN